MISFKYKPVRLRTGTVYRPLIPLTLYGEDTLPLFAMLDSGSDLTILPREIAEVLGLELKEETEITGISREPVKAKTSSIDIEFGKGHESYRFRIPVLIPLDLKDISLILGRGGFFNQFKITFDEQRKRIEFRKVAHQSA